jgi:hypothetical protein
MAEWGSPLGSRRELEMRCVKLLLVSDLSPFFEQLDADDTY